MSEIIDDETLPQDVPKPNETNSMQRQLVEGLDFYWEGPAMVFTAHFLLARGYCCDSGCRLCPYKTLQ